MKKKYTLKEKQQKKMKKVYKRIKLLLLGLSSFFCFNVCFTHENAEVQIWSLVGGLSFLFLFVFLPKKAFTLKGLQLSLLIVSTIIFGLILLLFTTFFKWLYVVSLCLSILLFVSLIIMTFSKIQRFE